MNSEKEISNQSNETQVEEIIRSKIINCPKCGLIRIEVKPYELPTAAKKVMSDKLELADYFLFCDNCDIYSISHNGDIFGL